ncbi:hypothetical protein K493DRAFT_319379 [Basidiobolus meristosporus CBS 931.73]|uniref:Uncharacterized protein n=1 Tax=Basidiobolus meristosporus CBS 931.73 TaxID=1314790 RepID=A0A1Y1XST3_9FUNG|nr:hypothetical protein K493DRAFT_319379 [Basidiobolus meristosporus CBS 931.73]|eukprot:ORX88556.1 hypothetical protein K493DRAFT_319379 [Basidiobolus meristosporus CBS 931.73]
MNFVTDFAREVDLSRLLGMHSTLGLLACMSDAPSYNLPIYLFGMWAYQDHQATGSMKLFTFMLAGSLVLDILYLIKHEWTWFALFTILSLALKPITILSSTQNLQIRGDPVDTSNWASNIPGVSAKPNNNSAYEEL